MKIKQIQIIVFLFYIFAQNIYAQKTQTMLQKENLKGKVKSVYITNGDTFIKVWFDKTGKIIRKERQLDLDWDGKNIIVWDNYIYDSKGCLLSFSAYNMAAPTNKMEYTCKYNSNGKVERYSSDGDAIYYKYDKKGNCISEMEKNLNDNYKERIYNEKNQLIEAFSYNGPVRLNVWHTDSTGRRAYETTKWLEPEKGNHTFYEYNEFGDVSRISVKAEYGDSIESCVITYDRYDDRGNWLEQTQPADSTGLSLDYYFDIYETYLWGNRITRIIEYYE